jgi:hypothetical protein
MAGGFIPESWATSSGIRTRDELIETREALIGEIVGKMPEAHRRFLLSFKRGEPDWTLLGIPAAAGLPAVKWREQNLAKLPAKKRAALVDALEKVLSAGSA